MSSHPQPLGRGDVRQEKDSPRESLSVMYWVLPTSIRDRVQGTSRPASRAGGQVSPASSSSTPLLTATAATTPMEEEEPPPPLALTPIDASGMDVAHHSASSAAAHPGVSRKYAQVGLQLASGSLAGFAAGDGAVERKMYLDGVYYLLRALPADLDEAEAHNLRSALPPALARGAGPDYGPGGVAGARPRSMLARSTRVVVAELVVLLCVVWPYLLALCRSLAYYERKYKVAEGVVSVVGHQTAALSEAVLGMSDTRIRQVLTAAVLYTADALASGFYDGVEEGRSRIERRR